MIRSRADPRFEAVKTSTFGIVFLGTPHRGSEATSLAQILANIAKVTFKSPKTQLLKSLEKESAELMDLLEDFSHIHSSVQIVSCYEQKETAYKRGLFQTKIMVSPLHGVTKNADRKLRLLKRTLPN